MAVCYIEIKIDDVVCKGLQKKGGSCSTGESSSQLPSCFYQSKVFVENCPLSLLPQEKRHVMAARGERLFSFFFFLLVCMPSQLI